MPLRALVQRVGNGFAWTMGILGGTAAAFLVIVAPLLFETTSTVAFSSARCGDGVSGVRLDGAGPNATREERLQVEAGDEIRPVANGTAGKTVRMTLSSDTVQLGRLLPDGRVQWIGPGPGTVGAGQCAPRDGPHAFDTYVARSAGEVVARYWE